MFTGLVREAAEIESLERVTESLWKIRILSRIPEANSWAIGASIATNGVCLTLVESEAVAEGRLLSFEMSPETMARSNLGDLKAGSRVHLEPSLKVGDELGGHWVLGHVDACGLVTEIQTLGDCRVFKFEIRGEARRRVAPYLVEKGSIAIDGVSLTLNSVEDAANGASYFTVMLIPHTLKLTHFASALVGQRVNLEGDILGKFSERRQEFRAAEGKNL
jgi:riboflavin synthase